eukprot:SRR837773.9117.p1 GENE.SRR837773.9117~~SRR837773.9117.p1  ORF type:complete len:222 (-),score=25.39 SRR837773.9117:41-706(-)
MWHIAAAEEQICEPEVMHLLHTFRLPLQELFCHFADNQGEDLALKDGSIWSEHCTAVLSERALHEFLEAMHFFPDVVQVFTLRQHLAVFVRRRGAECRQQLPGIRLDFRCFLECLCRIAFVYLSFYGNAVQQQAPSIWKCLWLLSLLRIRCRDLGPHLGLPESLVGGPHLPHDGGKLWRVRVESPPVDTLRLEDLVFWPALEAASGHVHSAEELPLLGPFG